MMIRRWLARVARRSITHVASHQHRQIPLPTDDNHTREDTLRTLRLYQAYELLQKKYDWAILKCTRLFPDNNELFFEEVVRFPKVNRDIVMFLMREYPKSKSIRIFLLNDAMKMLQLRKMHALQTLVETMSKYGCIHNLLKYRVLELSTPQDYAEFLVLQAALGGDYLVAMSFTQTLENQGLSVDISTISAVMGILMVDKTERTMSYNSYILLKMAEKYRNELLLLSLLLILEYLAENKFLFYVNRYMTVISDRLHELQGTRLNDTIRKIVVSNVHQNNLDTALQILSSYEWTGAQDEINMVLELILALESPEFIGAALKLVPEDVHNADFLDLELAYYGKHDAAKFNELVKRLLNPLRRSTVSVLFTVFLHQKKRQFSERMLELILKSHSGLSADDYNNIICEMLAQSNVDECISRLSNTDIGILKKAYLSVFERVVLKNLREDLVRYHAFFKEMQEQLLLLDEDDEVLGGFSTAIIKYASLCVNNRLARAFYDRLGNEPLKLSDVGLLDEFNSVLGNQSTRDKVCSLRVIAQQAMKEDDMDVVQWTVDELRFLGLSVKECVGVLKRLDRKWVESAFEPDVLDKTEVGN